MSEKNIEMMKKLIEKRNEQQNPKNKQVPAKKFSASMKDKKNQRSGGSNNRV
jgi:hypothetical protein